MSERRHRLYTPEIPEVRRGLSLRELCEAEEAVEMAHRLWREEGLFCGMSAGANALIALWVAEKLGKRKKAVAVLPDNGYRYMAEEHYVT